VTAKLSVVIPAYNNAKVIRETMVSVLTQEGIDDLELIVSDHSSTDGTQAVLEEFADDPRITLLNTPPGGGAPANWNRVTEAATGDYIKLVCGDDILRPGVLARQVRILDDHPDATLTACFRDIIDSDGSILMRRWGLRGLEGPMPGSRAVAKAVRAGSNLFGEPASVMMRRDALLAQGLWQSDFPYLIDQATYSRVLMAGDFVPDREVGATFRMSATQWSVVLVKAQAAQARAFHEWIHASYPGAVSRTDVVIGNVRASVMARLRKLSYRILKRRMR
jgi:glycosyltransferase involved in cell wall biosynthesis